VPGIREVFHARFARYAYPAHAHSTWTLFVVDDGMIRYDLDRHPHGSDPSMVGVLPPHVVHDGRPATSRGFRKRVLYLSDDLFGARLIGPAVDRPGFADPLLRSRISAMHDALVHVDAALEAESRLAFIVERLRRHLDSRPDGHVWSQDGNALAEQLRALLDTHLLETVTLASASRRLGASPAHLVRTFTKAFGIAPHAYQLGRRIETARQWLLDGRPATEVAAAAGFHDQSHFTRHFKRHVGTTPGRYAADPRRSALTAPPPPGRRRFRP
jgi:AraC-like DNA-binding protein